MASTSITSTTTLTSSTISSLPSHTNSVPKDPVPAHNVNPIVAFIIGLAIILLASTLNAAGLNLTKLDHVRTKSIPKSQRRRDWLRPLWLLGMVLYILSQLIGSTLALEYMRAEYVAPLGSSSLVFNFLFARFLVGTPVTSTDIYGTIVVVLGVVGIVAFGSINSGLASDTDVAHITYLWRRGGWLSFFFCMSAALAVVGIGVVRLDAILVERSDEDVALVDNDLPAGMLGGGRGSAGSNGGLGGFVGRIKSTWSRLMVWVQDSLERWTARQDDKQIAWTLGIGWACLGGGLAGGCLVFAKATVKLVSGSVSHQNPGNQFGHAAPIFTIILLSVTAVLQIICLNRGLRVYDSTLVVPVFYGIYTATGFLDSLIFNDEVDSYKGWTLFLIFVSILILISGVVLLTHKKPEHTPTPPGSASIVPIFRGRRVLDKSRRMDDDLETGMVGEGGERDEEEGGDTLWTVGNESDGEDELSPHRRHPDKIGGGSGWAGERASLIKVGEGVVSSPSEDRDPFQDEPEGWEDVGRGKGKSVVSL